MESNQILKETISKIQGFDISNEITVFVISNKSNMEAYEKIFALEEMTIVMVY